MPMFWYKTSDMMFMEKMLIKFLISFRMSEYAWISDRKDIIFRHEMVWGIGMQTSGILHVVYFFAQMIPV